MFSSTFVWILGALQVALVFLFLFGTTYDMEHVYSPAEYSVFLDIMVMLLLGFGYLMTFLKKYGLGAVGLTLLLTVVAIQLNLFVEPFMKFIYNGHAVDFPIQLDIPSLIDAEFSAATLLISYGAIIGRASPLQLLVMAIFQSFFYAINKVIFVLGLIQAEDVGGTLTIHLFGAYFGLAVSQTFAWPRYSENNSSSMVSDVLSLIGTTLLWVYWPSFVSATETGVPLHANYCVLHTTLALLGSTAATFFLSNLKIGKFHPLHIANSTLAGGVAIGASARLQVTPGGAFLLGILAGLLSVVGFVHVTPRLEEKFGLFDTCGVHNLHGLPSVLGGIASAIFVSIDSQADFLIYHDNKGGVQAGHQILAMVSSWVFAIVTGFVTGRVLRLLQESPSSANAVMEYDDAAWWEGDYFESAALCKEEDKSGRSRASVGIAPTGNVQQEGEV